MWKIKRIYIPAEDDDGYRVLIDRLWPRGISKTDAKLNEWLKDIAPSSELRKWFHHNPDLYTVFSEAYLKELQQGAQQQACKHLKRIAATQIVTLLYGARDPQINHARVLLAYLTSNKADK